MYRYHFDTSRGKWLLQFLKFGLFWFTVRSGDNKHDVLFENVKEIDLYVAAHGINDVYRRIAHPIEREPMFYVPGR